MLDVIHISFNNGSTTLGVALNKKNDKPRKIDLTDLVNKPRFNKNRIEYKINKFELGSFVFYCIKENKLINSYLEEIKKIDQRKNSSSPPFKQEKQLTKDVVVERLLSILEKADDSQPNKDVLQEWISQLRVKKSPSADFIQKVHRWNKLVEEKNQIYGGTKFVPFEL